MYAWIVHNTYCISNLQVQLCSTCEGLQSMGRCRLHLWLPTVHVQTEQIEVQRSIMLNLLAEVAARRLTLTHSQAKLGL